MKGGGFQAWRGIHEYTEGRRGGGYLGRKGGGHNKRRSILKRIGSTISV